MKKLLILFPFWLVHLVSFLLFATMLAKSGSYGRWDALGYLSCLFIFVVFSIPVYLLSAFVFKPSRCFGIYSIIFSFFILFASYRYTEVLVLFLFLIGFIVFNFVFLLFLVYIESNYPIFKSNYTNFKNCLRPKLKALKKRFNGGGVD